MAEPKSRTDICWYPMYVSYRRELSVKRELDKLNIENYVPMRTVFMRIGEEVVSKAEPVIHNLIFVNSSVNILSQLKMYNARCAPMQYMVSKSTDPNRPSRFIIVDPERMKQFMSAMEVNDRNNHRRFLAYDEEIFSKEGRRIRFVNGDFAGIEGTIKRVNKNRSLVITLPEVGVLVITIASASDIVFLE